MINLDATVAAIATPLVPDQGSIGIVRLSGPQALAVARRLFHAPGNQVWQSHRILYGYIRDPETQSLVDEALVLLMLAPRSYTREDVVEFHCHGGLVIVQQVLYLCLQQGAVLAGPGEFTLRAFLHGRLDLTQAESVAELVRARSPEAARVALTGLGGQLARRIRTVRTRCVELLADIEAHIDFADDLPPFNPSPFLTQLAQVQAQVELLLATAPRGKLLRSGLVIAILGQPNVGKSSLLNAWSQTDRAIVTDIPGTTRDVVDVELVVGGIPVRVLDTAGIRDTQDPVEQLGVERSGQVAQAADLVLLILDAQVGWTGAEERIYAQAQPRPVILVVNKVDRVECLPVIPSQLGPVVTTSALEGRGIPELEAAILGAVGQGRVQAADLDQAINQRQSVALGRVKVALAQVEATIEAGLPLDFWTIDLRSAIQALGEITGESVTESVLDQIFSQFCLGK